MYAVNVFGSLRVSTEFTGSQTDSSVFRSICVFTGLAFLAHTRTHKHYVLSTLRLFVCLIFPSRKCSFFPIPNVEI